MTTSIYRRIGSEAGYQSWIAVCAYLCVFLLFSIRPVFFTTTERMAVLEPVPALPMVGSDLRLMFRFALSWVQGGTPYVPPVPSVGHNPYPPLATVVFSPLVHLSFRHAYILLTLTTLAAYASIAFVLPLMLYRSMAAVTSVTLLAALGLSSYGLQLEIERGQFNVLAIACCLWSVYIFQRCPRRFRWAAYLLFLLSIQLKVYPAIFVLAFAVCAHQWRSGLVRWVALGAASVLLLFVLGPHECKMFCRTLAGPIVRPQVWIGNHSILSYQIILQQTKYAPYAHAISFSMLAVLCVSLLNTCYLVYVRGGKYAHYLVLFCTAGALLLPSESQDYKLALLPPAVAIFAAGRACADGVKGNVNILWNCAWFAFVFLFFTTLVPYVNKPVWMRNQCPVIALLVAAAWAMMLLEVRFGGSPRSVCVKDAPCGAGQRTAVGSRVLECAEE